VAGFVNTLAGGGSFLTVPLLVLVGLPPTVANATNRVGVLAQSAAAVAGFAREGVHGTRLGVRLLPAVLVGSWLGAWTAARLPEAWFGRLFGLLMLLGLPIVLRNPLPAAGSRRELPLRVQLVIYFALGVYGGAIQAGIGIPMLIALVAAGGLDLVRANGVKVVIVAALTVVALAQFAWDGKVAWSHGLVLAVGGSLGGYAASRFGARVGERLIRPVLTVTIVLLALRMLLAA
jgi:uncharacterized membrane protein YfcA